MLAVSLGLVGVPAALFLVLVALDERALVWTQAELPPLLVLRAPGTIEVPRVALETLFRVLLGYLGLKVAVGASAAPWPDSFRRASGRTWPVRQVLRVAQDRLPTPEAAGPAGGFLAFSRAERLG